MKTDECTIRNIKIIAKKSDLRKLHSTIYIHILNDCKIWEN